MIRWSNTTALISGLVLIVLSNAVVLSGVYYNRTGEADARITMTDRELGIRYWSKFDSENSGLTLGLKWRYDDPKYSYSINWGYPAWLDKEKLIALGFDTTFPLKHKRAARYYRKMLPREVLLVLEYNGPAYRARLKRLTQALVDKKRSAAVHSGDEKHKKEVENAERFLKYAKQRSSRLFVIDAGQDRKSLRNTYPDRSRYIIARGQISIRRFGANVTTNKPAYLAGSIRKLNIDRINVPHRARKIIDLYLKKNRYGRIEDKPHYAVTVVYGRRLEPWIEDIREISGVKK